MSALLQYRWVMNSAQNRCAFVRAEYVKILLLLLLSTSNDRLAESNSSHVASNDTVDGSDPVVSETAEHPNSGDLRCLDEATDNEMRVLLDSDGFEKQHHTEVSHFALTLSSSKPE